MVQKCEEIDDQVNQADAQYRRGLYYMRLNDLDRAMPPWKMLMNLPEERMSAELLFLKTAVLAFQACWERKENELQHLQREMKKLADATDYAYLMIGTPLMCVHQMEYLNRFPELCVFAEDAEKQALYYNQMSGCPGSGLKIYEVQRLLRRPPAIPKVYELLDLAKAQLQNRLFIVVISCCGK